MKRNSYPSKLLLFGEYLVLNQGSALSIPYSTYSLKVTSKSENNLLDEVIQKLFQHAKPKKEFENRLFIHSLEKFQKEITLTSNIPQGYGIGSSGAIVAFFYDYFIENKVSDLVALKIELALLEDFFHNKSSGIDPLTSFLNQGVVVESNEINNFEIHQDFLSKFELIDSKKDRVAKDAISKYNNWQSDSENKVRLEEALRINNQMIRDIIENKNPIKWIEDLSKWQFENWQFLIPDAIKSEWEDGLLNRSFFYKLCGAGDGGFFLKFYNH
jgi:mevalonate kinase